MRRLTCFFGLLIFTTVFFCNTAAALPYFELPNLAVDVSPANPASSDSHLAAKPIIVTNLSNKSLTISNFSVTGYDKTYIKYCPSNATNCVYASTCPNSQHFNLGAHKSCYIYLEANKVNAITAKNSQVTIKFNYTLSKYRVNAKQTLKIAYENTLYAGGMFAYAGDPTNIVNNIAKWNISSNSWSALASGLTGTVADVEALTIYGADLYAGGFFDKRIAGWNGTNWKTLNQGITGCCGVRALAVNGKNLYIGGLFPDITNNGTLFHANNIAMWDGSNWNALNQGTNQPNGQVHALAVKNNNLYVGGYFVTASGITVNHIAMWDGTNWNPMGIGTDGEVDGLAFIGNNLYAAGSFNTVSGTAAHGLAKWDITSNSWSSIPDINQATQISALAVNGSNLYVGGYGFYISGWTSWDSVAMWNTVNSSWNHLGPRIGDRVYALTTSGSDLYVGGGFTKVFNDTTTVTANKIAKWNGSTWSALGTGINNISGNYVFAVLVAPSISITKS